MDINSCYPGTYLKAVDLQGKTVRCTVESVQIEDIGGEEKPVLYFIGKSKGLVLNRTNAGTIAAMLGGETDEWVGKEIKIFPTKVSFQGSMVDAIRVRAEAPEAGEQDEIPF